MELKNRLSKLRKKLYIEVSLSFNLSKTISRVYNIAYNGEKILDEVGNQTTLIYCTKYLATKYIICKFNIY